MAATRRATYTQRKAGVWRRQWQAKAKKRWVGTAVAAAVTPTRVRQVWIT